MGSCTSSVKHKKVEPSIGQKKTQRNGIGGRAVVARPLEIAKEHKTEFYKTKDGATFVRRGGKIGYKIDFPSTADITAVLENVVNSSDKRTIALSALSDITDSEWGLATTMVTSDNKNQVLISVPFNAPVGAYTLQFLIKESDKDPYVIKSESKVVILFNPYSQLDSVFLKDSEQLNYFVEKENDVIMLGCSSLITKRGWIFGQYEHTTLDIILKALRKLEISEPIAKPETLIHGFKKFVENNLIDRIDTASVTGSHEILETLFRKRSEGEDTQEHNNQLHTLSWVLCSTITTLLRFFGIPCRIVTGYDICYGDDESGTSTFNVTLPKLKLDKAAAIGIYPFICWIEVWLNEQWQVIDETELIPRRELFIRSPSFFTRILGGTIRYIENGKNVATASMVVGLVCSSSPNDEDDPEILTNFYRRDQSRPQDSNIEAKLKLRGLSKLGDPIKVHLTVNHKTDVPVSVKFNVNISSIDDSGMIKDEVRIFSGVKTSPFDFSKEINYEEYSFILKHAQPTLLVTCIGSISPDSNSDNEDECETIETFARTKLLTLPPMILGCSVDESKLYEAGSQVSIPITFKAPSDISTLNDVNICALIGGQTKTELVNIQNISLGAAGYTKNIKINLPPTQEGQKARLVLNASSEEIGHFHNTKMIQIK